MVIGARVLPERVFVTRGEIVRGLGVSKDDVEKAVRAGALERRVLPGCKYGKYVRDEVIRVFCGEGGEKRREDISRGGAEDAEEEQGGG